MQGLSGFAVSMMIRNADTVLKGFAISMAAVLASLMAIPLFHTELGWPFFVGSMMMCAAVKMYAHYDKEPQKKPFAEDQEASNFVSMPRRRTCMLSAVLVVFLVTFSCATIKFESAYLKDAMSGMLTSEHETHPFKSDSNNSVSDLSTFTCAINHTLKVPTDNGFLKEWVGMNSFRGYTIDGRKMRGVLYLRNTTEIAARGKFGECTPLVDVIDWLTHQVNTQNGTLMVAYGELIHLHREKDFADKDGNWFDDDFDLWASGETTLHIGRLEPELFSRFGWSMRAYVFGKEYENIVFMQLFASCGHRPVTRQGKIKSSQPGIDLYPLVVVDYDKVRVAKDLWQMTTFHESWAFPSQRITFNSSKSTNKALQLQLPAKSFDILECCYGNWTVPSGKHANGCNFDINAFLEGISKNATDLSVTK